jgi:hypothetical protein
MLANWVCLNCSRIAEILRIKIATVHPNTNLLCPNSKYSYYLLFQREDKIITIFLNSSLLFQIYNSNNIFTIQNIIIFLLSLRSPKIIIFLNPYLLFSKNLLFLLYLRSKYTFELSLICGFSVQ